MKALKTIQKDFYKGLKAFFKELNIPLNYWAEEPANPADILGTENYTKGIPLGQGWQPRPSTDERSLFSGSGR